MDLFRKRAEEIIEERDIGKVQQLLFAEMDNAGFQYLSDGKDAIHQLMVEVSNEYIGNNNDYGQGFKDGLRKALALLGNTNMNYLIRGGSLANPNNKEG